MGQGSSWNFVIGVFEILKSVALIPRGKCHARVAWVASVF